MGNVPSTHRRSQATHSGGKLGSKTTEPCRSSTKGHPGKIFVEKNPSAKKVTTTWPRLKRPRGFVFFWAGWLFFCGIFFYTMKFMARKSTLQGSWQGNFCRNVLKITFHCTLVKVLEVKIASFATKKNIWKIILIWQGFLFRWGVNSTNQWW